jgi:hypothetical protein
VKLRESAECYPPQQSLDGAQNESVLLLSILYHRFCGQQMDDEDLPSIRIPTEAFMEDASTLGAGSRRNEDIALDLMKFVAMTTGYGRTSSSGVGFQGTGAAAKPEDYAEHLLELYGKCLQAVGGKK